MKDLEQNLTTIAKVTTSTIKSLLGDEAEFIIIPIMKADEKFEMAVISSITGRQLCMTLGLAAQQTVEKFDPEMDSKVKNKIKLETSNLKLH